MLSRRQAIIWSAAGLAFRSGVSAAADAAGAFKKKQYDSAIVIDALGGPGGFDPTLAPDAPLSPKFVEDVRASGVTAVNVTVNMVGNGADRFEQAVLIISQVEHEIAAHPDVFLKVLNAADITQAKATKRTGLIFGFQDSSMLDGDLKRLTLFADLGVRICQPTYNIRNLMGDGCLEEANGGLSHLGRDFIAEVNRLHLLLDLSHAGPRTIAEGIAASKEPVAITHTGCRALVDVPRNTHDKELTALADRGGVAGIYFMPFLRASGQPHAEDVIRHLEHAVNVCGENAVGLGTDGGISGIEINDAYRKSQREFYESRAKAGISAPGEAADLLNLIPEYNDPRRFQTLAEDLSKRGWTSGRIEKILGGNFARLFKEVWKS
jgi:membrane dipeptidase